QLGKKPHPEPSRLLAFAGAPALKLLAVRQIETLEKIALKRLRGVEQSLCRNGTHAVSSKFAQGQNVDRDAIAVQSDRLTVGDNHPAVCPLNERPQVGQTPPQCGTGIIRNGPKHITEPVAPVRTRGNG